MFTGDKPIYKQIKDIVKRNILNDTWEENNKIPSVRDLSSKMSVNPNTIMRAFRELQNEDILLNKRGIGNIVKDGARDRIFKEKQKNFKNYKIVNIIKEAKLLNISKADFVEIVNNKW